MNVRRFARRVDYLGGGEISEFMKLAGNKEIISFAGGFPDPAVFPLQDLKKISGELIDSNGSALFQYSSTEGIGQLKDYICKFLKRRNINCQPEELLITTGSQQALDLISKVFIDPGDKVITEEPAYVGGLGAIRSYQAEIIGIPQDASGMESEALERKLEELAAQGEMIKFIYLVPDYSNPSGKRLSGERRYKLLELANRFGFYLIEDTPYNELNYYQPALPTLKELDNDERVIYLGTFSKFFVPGLRIGWVLADQELIKILGRAKQNTDLSSNSFGQVLIARAGENGLIEEQIKRVKPYYRERLEKMETSLEKYFPEEVSWDRPEGGFFFWVKLPEKIKSKELLIEGLKRKVAFVPGNAFFAFPEDGDNYIRLSFTSPQMERMEEGCEILGKLLKEYL